LFKILSKVERGDGDERDIALLENVAGLITGKTLCAFGDAAATPVLTTLQHFKEEYVAHVQQGRCPRVASWRAGSVPAIAAH
jgi:NADH-quinone oxidoreductase subunit F